MYARFPMLNSNLWSRPFAGEHVIRLGLVQVIGKGCKCQVQMSHFCQLHSPVEGAGSVATGAFTGATAFSVSPSARSCVALYPRIRYLLPRMFTTWQRCSSLSSIAPGQGVSEIPRMTRSACYRRRFARRPTEKPPTYDHPAGGRVIHPDRNAIIQSRFRLSGDLGN